MNARSSFLFRVRRVFSRKLKASLKVGEIMEKDFD